MAQRRRNPEQAEIVARTAETTGVDTDQVGDDALKIRKTIRIAVSGDVFVTAAELKVIDSADFQRLRGIRQLGTVNLVYPTAIHTRFDHSLGTLAMAARMIEAVRSNTHNDARHSEIAPRQEIVARLYALLHDITHVPFGHTIEDELQIFGRHDENYDRIHRFLGPASEIGTIIKTELSEEVYSTLLRVYLYNDKGTAPAVSNALHQYLSDLPALDPADVFIYDLVSNTVCADLLDYLRRDDHFCNLGIALEYRFLNFLYLDVDNDGKRRAFVRLWKSKEKPTPRRDTLSDLGRLLESRYLLAERAYFHHAKIVAGVMIGRALLDAKTAKVLTESDLLIHSDDTLLRWLATDDRMPDTAKHMADCVIHRRLHRTLHVFSESDFLGASDHDHAFKFLENALARVQSPEQRREFEDELGEVIGANRGDVLMYAPPFERDPETGESKVMNMKLAKMKVLWRGDKKFLKDIDDTVIRPRLAQILAAHRALWSVRLIVSRELSDKQCALLLRLCTAELLGGGSSREPGQLLAAYEDVVEANVAEIFGDITVKPQDFPTLRNAAATLLLKTARDGRPFRKRLASVADVVKRQHFGGAHE
ncbi:MAG TPA: HD domain-containing protein [Thermoanaerobaculia bacterium]|jgi:HD superfamily phosphohydrolase|nr:HD domain-containing protein [Thermoanaerobaculia bacterium]